MNSGMLRLEIWLTKLSTIVLGLSSKERRIGKGKFFLGKFFKKNLIALQEKGNEKP
jgi:hypothetical protein